MITGNEPAHQLDGIYASEQRREGYMSIRDLFAAMAMQGMLAKYGTDYQAQHAKESVYMADELIKELNKLL